MTPFYMNTGSDWRDMVTSVSVGLFILFFWRCKKQSKIRTSPEMVQLWSSYGHETTRLTSKLQPLIESQLNLTPQLNDLAFEHPTLVAAMKAAGATALSFDSSFCTSKAMASEPQFDLHGISPASVETLLCQTPKV